LAGILYNNLFITNIAKTSWPPRPYPVLEDME
jgi:hypothetical protein